MSADLAPLLTRRSVSVKEMVPPAPSASELDLILRAATRVPDHGKLCPWRIVVLQEQGQRKLGTLAADIFAKAHSDATPAQLEAERLRFARAPLCLAVLSMTKQGTKPIWEQELSAGAVCMNILHAVHMLGYAGKWLTEWVAYAPEILATLGGASEHKIAGFIYIGSKSTEPEDRERPKLEDVVSEH